MKFLTASNCANILRLLPLLMVIMERSRSPLRPSPTVEGTRPMVNFPIWTRPTGYGATSQEQGQQVAHPMASQWNQGHSGVPATREMPLSQGTVQIPPGQSGASQNSLGMSQSTVATPHSWYSPHGPQPVPPRPRAHGMGLAGANFSTSSTIGSLIMLQDSLEFQVIFMGLLHLQ